VGPLSRSGRCGEKTNLLPLLGIKPLKTHVYSRKPRELADNKVIVVTGNELLEHSASL
jgi:hypothetical protein